MYLDLFLLLGLKYVKWCYGVCDINCLIVVLYLCYILCFYLFVGKFVFVLLFLVKYFKLLLYCKIIKNLGWGFWNSLIYMFRFIFVWL